MRGNNKYYLYSWPRKKKIWIRRPKWLKNDSDIHSIHPPIILSNQLETVLMLWMMERGTSITTSLFTNSDCGDRVGRAGMPASPATSKSTGDAKGILFFVGIQALSLPVMFLTAGLAGTRTRGILMSSLYSIRSIIHWKLRIWAIFARKSGSDGTGIGGSREIGRIQDSLGHRQTTTKTQNKDLAYGYMLAEQLWLCRRIMYRT